MAQGSSKSGRSGSTARRSSSSRSGSGGRSASSRSGSSSNGANAKPRSGSRSSSRSGSSSSRSRAASRSGRSQSGRASSSGARGASSSSRSSRANRSMAGKATGAVKERLESTRETVTGGAQSAGHAIGSAASKAKGPALAGGAALAGLVGGMTIASRGARRRVLGLPIPRTRRPLIQVKRPTRVNTTRDLMKAAGHMGNAGRQMAELASEVRLARQEMGNGRRRSPVEVVLDGLTARRPR
jgi:hypothetical protein